MGLMILGMIIGTAAASGALLFGGSLLLALSLYALTGAASILVIALALYLAARPGSEPTTSSSTPRKSAKENAPV